MCCYFCGNQAGDYVFEEITADNAFCAPAKQLSSNKTAYVVTGNNLELVNTTFKSAMGCIGCRGLVNIVKEAAAVTTDEIHDQAYSYCDGLLVFRGICKSLVDKQIANIVYLIHNNITASIICSHFLNLCDRQSSYKELHSFGARPARITILDPIVDGDVAREGDILKLGTINGLNLEEYIGLDDGNQDEKDKTLKFLAKYRLIANKRFCQDCKRDEMTLVKAADRPDGYIW